MKVLLTEKKYNKALKKAYRQGRREGFDKGFQTAKILFEDFATGLKAEIEELNTEIIIGKQEAEDADPSV